MIWSKFEISLYQGFTGTQNGPPRPKNGFFGPKKNFENFFQKVHPKTRCLIPKPTFYHMQIPSYGLSKIGGTKKSQNFEKPITPPLGVLEPKNFGFPSFSPGGTSMPKMIKIGEIRVLSYLRLPWNAPYKQPPPFDLKLLYSGYDAVVRR